MKGIEAKNHEEIRERPSTNPPIHTHRPTGRANPQSRLVTYRLTQRTPCALHVTHSVLLGSTAGIFEGEVR
jgi:hypothetical protein